MMSGWWIQTMQWKCRNEWQEWNKRRDKIRSCVKVAFGSYVAPSPLVGQEFSFCLRSDFRSCAPSSFFLNIIIYHDSFVNCTKWSKFSGVRHQAVLPCSVAGGGYYYDCWMLLLPPAEQPGSRDTETAARAARARNPRYSDQMNT